MDLKDREKLPNYRDYITSRYYESHAGHLFVNNVNPFNTVGSQAGDDKDKGINKRKSEEYDYYESRQTKEPSTSQSKEMVNEILKNYPFNGNIMVNDEYDEIHEAFLSGHRRTASQPMVSMSGNVFGNEYTCCSRAVRKAPHYEHKVKYGEYDQQNKNHRAFSNDEMTTEPRADENKRCEKTTYCRPLLNMYNQEFVYKTMQRNARLQKLVRKLVIAREREKRREAWNNYINDLKNKHRYYSNEPCTISPQYVPGDYNSLAAIDDFYNMRRNWPQSNLRQHLLDDFYGPYRSPNRFGGYSYDFDTSVPDVRTFTYDNNRFCYPTSSQANMLKWNRERLGFTNGYSYEFGSNPSSRYYRGNTIVVEKEQKDRFFDKLQGTTRPFPINPQSPNIKSPLQQRLDTTELQNPITSTRHDKENLLPQVEEDQELTAAMPESPPNEDIYYPYKKDAVPTNGTDAVLTEKDTNEVPHLQGNLKQKPSEEKKNAGAVKPVKFEKDNENICKKLSDFKTKMATKMRNKQESRNDNELQKSDSFKEKLKKVSDNIAKLKEKIRQSEEEKKQRTLAKIEAKIDGLMKSIDSIMLDLNNAQKNRLVSSGKSTAVSCCTIVTASRNDLIRHRSDPYGLIKNEDLFCGVVTSSRSLAITEVEPSDLRRHRDSSTSRMDKILLEEMKKSDQVKRDIEELLKIRNERNNCSLQITFDIPTRERSTEVTESLSKAKIKSEIPLGGNMDQGHRQMTIAVNTDPLGLLALLRVSKETVKQLLSYVPHLNYISYLSLLPLPLTQGVSHYICNICGAAFRRPSQLSDHIKQHNLGRTRDCCVCRHMLDMRRTRPGLFTCRCCGQRFTRAYCCELHEQSCAQQLGLPRDVTSGHLLLH